MLSNSQSNDLLPKINVMRIIVGAMIMGVVVFTIVALVIREDPKFLTTLPLMAWLGIIFAVPCFIASFIAPVIMRKKFVGETSKLSELKDSGDVSERIVNRALAGLQSMKVVGCALIEGATFFNIVCYILEGSVYSLAVAGVGVILMLMKLPMSSNVIEQVESFISDAKRGDRFGV